MADDRPDSDYAEGVRDGRLSALERRVDGHDVKSESHERRLAYLERIVLGVFAVLMITGVWPTILEFLGAHSNGQ